MAPNVPALLEAHYAVPALGAVLNALNVRLDARDDRVLPRARRGEGAHHRRRVRAGRCKAALAALGRDRSWSSTSTIRKVPRGERLGASRYEELLRRRRPGVRVAGAARRVGRARAALHVGHDRRPKGVVYHHRGAYLNALGNALAFRLDADSVYLWTLPMFHCSGWTYTWAVTAAGGTHVCLRRVDPARDLPRRSATTASRTCAARRSCSIMLIHAPDEAKLAFDHVVDVATGGAAPPSAVIEAMEAMGFRVTHLYGLTESYGPATLCAWQDDWSGAAAHRARAAGWRGRACRCPRSRSSQVADPDDRRAGAARRRDARRGDAPRQHDHEGLSHNPTRRPRRRSRTAGSDSGDLAVWHPTATSRSRTAARTSSSPAARTSARSRSRSACIAIRR